jgi:hypothetical protein
MASKKIFSITPVLTFCFIAAFGLAQALAQDSAASAANPNPELVGQLTQQLNITPKQATGGAGAIFGYAKNKLSPSDFGKIAAAVPGMNGFLKAAPSTGAAAAKGAAGNSNPLQGAVPGIGGTSSGAAASMASQAGGGLSSLVPAFQKLGLSPSMVGKFAPVLQNYIGAKGGSGTAALFSSVLK